MDYKKKYKEALEKIRTIYYQGKYKPEVAAILKETLQNIFPELQESEDEKIRKALITYFQRFPYDSLEMVGTDAKEAIAWIEKQKEPEDKGEISDGYHTFNELYYYRMLYNAAFFNLLPKHLVHKSKRHHGGEECFGGGWFIVMANLPTGQISNHYELKDWDLFQIPEKEIADEWDGHTPQEAAKRLHEYLYKTYIEQIPNAPVEQKPTDNPESRPEVSEQIPTDNQEPKPDFKVGDWLVIGDKVGQVSEIREYHYVCKCTDGWISNLSKPEGNSTAHLWTIKDAKSGDVISWDDSDCIALFKSVYDEESFISYGCVGHCTGIFEPRQSYHDIEGAHPATYEQCYTLFAKMKEAGYKWNNQTKQLDNLLLYLIKKNE